MSPIIISIDVGGKPFAKELVLAWIVNAGGLNLKALETITGLPQKLLSPLLAELIEEGVIRLNRVIFKSVRR